MATLKISSEDAENIKIYENKSKTGVVVPNDKKKKSFLDNKMTTLQDLKDGGSKHVAKKAKITENKENEEPKTSKKTSIKEEDTDFPLDLLHNLEYRMDILNYLKELEKTFPRPNPNYISILIDWLASIADEYKFSEETFHLSVNYIDRFLSKVSVVRTKFQLVGAAALMVANKMEEYYPLDATEWSFLTAHSFTSKQVLRMEMLLLQVLRFIVKPPTILEFIKRFCSAAKVDQTTECFAMAIQEKYACPRYHKVSHAKYDLKMDLSELENED
nr:unnamed protein product [Callosobruchus analis]